MIKKRFLQVSGTAYKYLRFKYQICLKRLLILLEINEKKNEKEIMKKISEKKNEKYFIQRYQRMKLKTSV